MPPLRASLPATRERILAYLREHPSANSVALAREWGLTREDVRYHLQKLLREGILEVIPSHPEGRGRPVAQYALTVAAAPNNTARLCSALLSLIDTSTAADELAQKIAHQLLPPIALTGSGAVRFNQAAAYLASMNYPVRWEARLTGPRITFRRCPYAALPAGQRALLCQVDGLLLENLLGAPVRMQACIAQGAAACVFGV